MPRRDAPGPENNTRKCPTRPKIRAAMGNFMGGSAWAMAQQIAEGYILVSERTYKRLERVELDKLGFEMEKLLREVRGEQVPLDDIQAIQQKSRKASRLMGAVSQLRQYQQRLR